MAAVHILEATVWIELEQDHRRVLADISSAKEVIYDCSNLFQALACKKLRVDDSLQRSRHNGG